MQVYIDGSDHVTASGSSTERVTNALYVGNGGGTAILSLTSDAVIRAINGAAVDDGGVVRGDGQIVGDVFIGEDGELRAGAGEQLRITGDFLNEGSVQAIGSSAALAEIEFDGTVTENFEFITGHHATFRFNSGLYNEAVMAFSGGSSDVFGDVDNQASIIVSGGAVVTFYDDVVQDDVLQVSEVGLTNSVAVFFGAVTGGGSSSGGGDIFFEGDLRPGNSAATVEFQNDVQFGSGATLEIELGGATPGTQYDQMHVTGDMSLDGALAVSLISGFNPVAGNSFDILDWTARSGTFDTLSLPALSAGLSWNTSQLYATGVLSVAAGLPGDYNFDGTVDAADYVVWRKNDGTPAGYDTWRANFGRTAGSGGGEASSGNAAVPEPAAVSLLLAASLCIGFARRRYA
jgi:hypothetical protein